MPAAEAEGGKPIDVGNESDEAFVGSVSLLLLGSEGVLAVLLSTLEFSVELLPGMCLICIYLFALIC